ncbi:MAG: alanyl-tRNA editing protein, partial [Chloroflexi bacterium]
MRSSAECRNRLRSSKPASVRSGHRPSWSWMPISVAWTGESRKYSASSSSASGRSSMGRMLAYPDAMTENLAATDAYARTTSATVVSSGPDGVVLDRTVFYPGGGGQPADTGLLRTDAAAWTVTGARKAEGEIVHAVEPAPDGSLPEPGADVTAEIDWVRRHGLMRTHSALHVLCGVIWRDHGAQVTGGNMEPLAGRMDF